MTCNSAYLYHQKRLDRYAVQTEGGCLFWGWCFEAFGEIIVMYIGRAMAFGVRVRSAWSD